jgi:hypothetical protein
MSKECTTHHHACDCREEKFKQLEQENAALRELTSTLGAPNHINIPVEKWHELRKDKERLDWLDHNAIPWTWMSPEKIDGLGPIVVTWKSNRTLRAAIDAARKEAQPWAD